MSSFVADTSLSTDPGDNQLVIRQVTPDIVTFSVPFLRFGVPVGGRGTAVRLPSNEILVYVSSPHTAATKDTIANMGGKVKWLVAPDGEHYLYMKEYSEAYPNAKTIGVERFKDSMPGIEWTGLFGAGGETQHYGFEPHISIHQVSAFRNHELVVIHHPSGTLLEADMVFNLPATEQHSRSCQPFIWHTLGAAKLMQPGSFLHDRSTNSLTPDKALLKTELQPIMSAEWDRLIPCHGDMIETGGRVAWDKVWAKHA